MPSGLLCLLNHYNSKCLNNQPRITLTINSLKHEKKRLLITRPLLQSKSTAWQLSCLGFETEIAPLIEIKYFDYFVAPTQDQIIITTSQHAIPSIPLGHPNIGIGKQAQDAQDLHCYIKENYPNSQKFLYLRGTDISYPLSSKLQADGYCIAEQVVYEAVLATEIAPSIVEQITSRTISGVLLYSARCASNFIQLTKDLDLQHLTAFTLSNKVATPLYAKRWSKILFPEIPTERELINLIHFQLF